VQLVEQAIAKEILYIVVPTNLRFLTREELHFIACVAVETLTLGPQP